MQQQPHQQQHLPSAVSLLFPTTDVFSSTRTIEPPLPTFDQFINLGSVPAVVVNPSSSSSTPSPPSSSLSNDTINNIQTITNQNSNPEANFHPIACEQCRKVHKFCTKILPICDRCAEKGIPCEYKTPKRMRYQKNANGQPSSKSKKSKSNQTSNSCTSLIDMNKKPPQKLSKKEVLDYFYSMNFADGVIDRKLLEDHIKHPSEKKEIHALFYAIKGLVEQRFGISTAEASIKKSRDLLAPFFDSVDNFNVACTYSTLASYEMGSGRRSLCQFYIGAAKCYVDSKKDEEMNANEKALKRGVFMFDIFLSDNEFCLTMLVKDFPKIFEYFTKEKLPPEITRALQQDITPENCVEHFKLFEVVGGFIRRYVECSADRPQGEDVQTRAKASELFKAIISNGVKMSLLTKAGYEDCHTVEEAALRITFLTEQDLFSYFSVIILTYVAMATRVHLRIVNKIELGQRQNLMTGVNLDNTIVSIDYYQILEKDYTALKSLGKKYKRVEVEYGVMLLEIEQILQRRQQQQQQLSFKIIPSSSSGTIGGSASSESPMGESENGSIDPFLTNDDMLHMFLSHNNYLF